MTTANPIAVREYLTRVRTALADLPAGELDEVLDDVRPHLEEIAAELGGDARLPAMVARLGTPESYAAELRAAGDYPPPAAAAEATPGKRPSNVGLRLAVWLVPVAAVVAGILGLQMIVHRPSSYWIEALLPVVAALALSAWYVSRRGVDAVEVLPEVRRLDSALAPGESGWGRVVRYLRSLEPAWWLACTALFVLVGVVLLRGWGHPVPVVLALGTMAGLALWAGPRARTERRWLWATVPLSAFAVGAVFGLVNEFVDRVGPYGHFAYLAENEYQPPAPTGGLRNDGRPVHNIYAFDAKGKPMADMYLYDHAGRPIELARYGCDPRGELAYAESGRDNQFPRPVITNDGHEVELGDPDAWYGESDPDGLDAPADRRCEERAGVPFTAAIPQADEPGEPGEPGEGDKEGAGRGSGNADKSPKPTSSSTTKPSSTG